jgi:hypothetical protein
MFANTEYVHLRFNKIEHLKMEKDEKEVPLVQITLELNPLTPALAQDLSDFMRASLYTRTDAEVNSQLHGAIFNLGERPQEIVVRMAHDQGKASFTIKEAKVGHFHAKRSKKSPTWRLQFKVTCSPSSEHELAQIVDCYTKQRVCTFADAHPYLFAEVGKEEEKTRKAASRANGATAEATTH